MKITKSIVPAYSVAGGNTNFEGLRFQGATFLEVQVLFAALNQADHKIRIQESTDGQNYVDSKDEEGNFLEIVLPATTGSDIIKVSNFNADYIRARFIKGTTGTGSILTINFLME